MRSHFCDSKSFLKKLFFLTQLNISCIITTKPMLIIRNRYAIRLAGRISVEIPKKVPLDVLTFSELRDSMLRSNPIKPKKLALTSL